VKEGKEVFVGRIKEKGNCRPMVVLLGGGKEKRPAESVFRHAEKDRTCWGFQKEWGKRRREGEKEEVSGFSGGKGHTSWYSMQGGETIVIVLGGSDTLPSRPRKKVGKKRGKREMFKH